ncbi:UNVERIFIED_CONTAM: hypothetical protein RMT77_002807 [Armadillidium vulgare]
MAYNIQIPDDLFQDNNEEQGQQQTFTQQQQMSARQQQQSTPVQRQERNDRNRETNPLDTRSRVGASYQYTPGQQCTPPPDPFMHNQLYYRRSVIPPPLKFCMEQGHDFEKFLMDFEIYCEHTYPDVTDTWSRVMPQFLEGDMLDAFNNIDGGRLPYYQVKEELSYWTKSFSK